MLVEEERLLIVGQVGTEYQNCPPEVCKGEQRTGELALVEHATRD